MNTTTASRAPDRKKAVRYHWAVYLGTEGADHAVALGWPAYQTS